MKSAAALATLLALFTSAHAVDVFKWTDAQGVVHYGDRPPLTRAGNAASAATISVPGNELSDEEIRAAQARLDQAREQITTPVYPQSTFTYRTRRPASTNPCADAWRAYEANAACFSRHRAGDGKGVSAAGQAYCTNLPQPTCAR